LSTDAEIQEVYLSDIAKKSRLVAGKKDGAFAFLDGLEGFHTISVYGGIISKDAQDLLRRVYLRDLENGVVY